MILRVRSAASKKELQHESISKPPSLKEEFRVVGHSLHEDLNKEDIEAKLHKKTMECQILNQQLERSIGRQSSLERELSHMKKSTVNVEQDYIRIDYEYPTQPQESTRETSDISQIDNLREELRFYKDALVNKSQTFDRLQEMLADNQEELVCMVTQNRHLEELVRQQHALIQELTLKNEKLVADRPQFYQI